jgi:hypothetical protein
MVVFIYDYISCSNRCVDITNACGEINQIYFCEMINGGANRDRTDDLLHAMQALYQLSYGPLINVSFNNR